MRRVGCVLVALLLVPAAAPRAQCTKDTDCKGERVCVEGECREPEPQGPAHRVYTGWALGAGILGTVGAAISLSTAIGSEVENSRDNFIPAMPLGASSHGVSIIFAPIVQTGGRSVRNQIDVPGVFGLRVTAWVFYGLCSANGVALTALGITGTEPPPGAIAAGAGLGVLSQLFFATDAFLTRNQAKARLAGRSASVREAPVGFTVAPFLTSLRAPDGRTGGMLGVGGQF